MVLALLLSAVLGALCGMWLHVVGFTVLTVVVVLLFSISMAFTELSLMAMIVSGLALLVAMAAGFVLVHLTRYLLDRRKRATNSKSPKLDPVQEYLRD